MNEIAKLPDELPIDFFIEGKLNSETEDALLGVGINRLEQVITSVS